MNELDCRKASELLPDRAAGTLQPGTAEWLDAHLAACPRCAAELALVQRLHAGAATPPIDLAHRVREALRHPEAIPALRPARTGWLAAARTHRAVVGLATAATLVLAAAGGLLYQRTRPPVDAEIEIIWEGLGPEQLPTWVTDDGLVAGAPVLEDLSDISDEDLAIVLQELDG